MFNKIFLIVSSYGCTTVCTWENTSLVSNNYVCCVLYTIIALAGFMGRATESLAIVSGPRIGGLLNATFGNAVELIISIFALQAGLIEVVLASLTGSVLEIYY